MKALCWKKNNNSIVAVACQRINQRFQNSAVGIARAVLAAFICAALILLPTLSANAGMDGGAYSADPQKQFTVQAASGVPAHRKAAPVISAQAASGAVNKKAEKKRAEKAVATLKATWYTGDVLGHTGSGGSLHHAKSIALNNSQRKSLGIKYGEELYLKFPEPHKNLDGWYELKDSGCSKGIVDVFYRTKGSVPSKFKRTGVIRKVKMYTATPPN